MAIEENTKNLSDGRCFSNILNFWNVLNCVHKFLVQHSERWTSAFRVISASSMDLSHLDNLCCKGFASETETLHTNVVGCQRWYRTVKAFLKFLIFFVFLSLLGNKKMYKKKYRNDNKRKERNMWKNESPNDRLGSLPLTN